MSGEMELVNVGFEDHVDEYGKNKIKEKYDFVYEESKSGKVQLSRPVYLSSNTLAGDDKQLKDYLATTARFVKRAYCPAASFWQLLFSFIPPLTWLPKYSWRSNFLSDILAGLTVGFMAIPEGLAYSKLAGMPPVYGLYTNTIPSLVYIVLGTSRHAIFGPITTLSLLTSAIRYKYLPCEDCWKNPNITVASNDAPPDDGTIPNLTPIELGSTIAFLVGVYLILMGLLRLSMVTNYLSDQVVGGFTIGVAVQVASGQLDSIFGIALPKSNSLGKTVMNFVNLFRLIAHTNVVTFSIFLACFVFLLVIKLIVNPRVQPKLRFPLPGELVVVLCGTLASYYGNLHKKYGVKIVDTIPAGLPEPVLPRFDIISLIWADCIAPAVVTFALSISLAKLFAKRNGYKVDATQEFYAYGAMNVFGSFFQCINAGQSMARSLVCERSGGKTQLCALVAVVVGIIVILVIAPFMETLPSCVLSSIVVAACVMVLANIREVMHLYRCSKLDLMTYLLTAAGVIGLDVTYGLAVGVGSALLTVILRSQMTKVKSIDNEASVLYQCTIDKTKAGVKNANDMCLNDIKIVQLTSPLFYANVDKTKAKVLQLCTSLVAAGVQLTDNAVQESTEKQIPLSANAKRILILDMAGVSFMDMMGVNALKEIKRDLEKTQVDLFLCGCTVSHHRLMQKANFFDSDSESFLFPTLIDAISFAKSVSDVQKL